MKKLLVILALCMALCVLMVACDKQPDGGEETTPEQTTPEVTTPEETTPEDTSEEPTTEDPTTEDPTTEDPTTEEPTTEEPTTEEQPPEPVKVVASLSFDAMGNVYGTEIDMDNLYFATSSDYAAWGKVANIDHRVDCLKVAGWVAFFTETEGVLGYAIDGAAAVYPEGFSTTAGQDVMDHLAATAPDAHSAARMFSDIPVKGLEAGEHTVALVAKDADGNEEVFAEFKLVKVDNSLKIDLHTAGISGSYPDAWAGNGLATTPALDPTDALVILHYGSLNLGEIDLSQYTKVVVTYGNMAGAYTGGSYDDEYNATQKRVLLLNAPSSIQEGTAFEYLPTDEQIITSANYEPSEASLVLRTVEIDLSTVEYNGQVYLTFDFRNDANAFGYLANLIVVTSVVFE